MPERHHPAGHRVANLINPGTDWRFDMVTDLLVGETLPTAPALHHEIPLELSENAKRERKSYALVPCGQQWLLINGHPCPRITPRQKSL